MTKIARAIVLSFLCGFAANAQTGAPLTLSKTISLPGVIGGFDHFAIDLSGDVLFAAAKDNHTIEAVNLKTGKLSKYYRAAEAAWPGVGSATHRLYVADGKLAQLKVYQGNPLKVSGALKLSDDADDMVYDEQNGMLYVGHGGSNAANPARIAIVNTKDFTLAANLDVSAHPEALDLDGQGQRVFANIAGAAQVAVIDTKTNAVVDAWTLKDALITHPWPMTRSIKYCLLPAVNQPFCWRWMRIQAKKFIDCQRIQAPTISSMMQTFIVFMSSPVRDWWMSTRSTQESASVLSAE